MKFLSTIKLVTIATTALAFSVLPNFAQSRETFPDIRNNVYKEEIEEAVRLGIVKGFPDGKFRPRDSVSREQAAVMIVQAIDSEIEVDLEERPRRSVRPFIDVPSDRWSAKQIKWLQWNLFPAGTGQLTGTFRPQDPITRIELVDFIRRTAEAMQSRTTGNVGLVKTEEPIVFSDVTGYDKVLTMQMSAFCRVASPLNERGKRFAPDRSADRDYTAAAIVRALKCE